MRFIYPIPYVGRDDTHQQNLNLLPLIKKDKKGV